MSSATGGRFRLGVNDACNFLQTNQAASFKPIGTTRHDLAGVLNGTLGRRGTTRRATRPLTHGHNHRVVRLVRGRCDSTPTPTAAPTPPTPTATPVGVHDFFYFLLQIPASFLFFYFFVKTQVESFSKVKKSDFFYFFTCLLTQNMQSILRQFLPFWWRWWPKRNIPNRQVGRIGEKIRCIGQRRRSLPDHDRDGAAPRCSSIGHSTV